MRRLVSDGNSLKDVSNSQPAQSIHTTFIRCSCFASDCSAMDGQQTKCVCCSHATGVVGTHARRGVVGILAHVGAIDISAAHIGHGAVSSAQCIVVSILYDDCRTIGGVGLSQRSCRCNQRATRSRSIVDSHEHCNNDIDCLMRLLNTCCCCCCC
jgi:hypothetical protein